MSNNDRRIRKAYNTFWHYAELTENSSREPMQDILTDLFSDMRHFCEKYTLDFDSASRISEEHFTAERSEP